MYIKNEYYSILNSKRTDSLSVIKKNYRNLVKIHHPDVGGDANYMKKINLAMDIINEFHEENYNKENNKSTNRQNTNKNSHNTNKSTGKSTNNGSNSYKAKTKTKHYNSTKKKATSNKSYNKNVECPNCGFSNDVGDNYCIMCGHHLKSKKENSDSEEDNSWIPGIFCVGVIIVSVGIILFTICWPMALIYFYIFYKFIFN